MTSPRTPWRALWLAWRDTAIAMVLATLLATPFLMLALKGRVDEAIDPQSMPTCTAWQLPVASTDTPEASRALSLVAQALPADGSVTWELIEQDGSAWLRGCFPDGTGGREVSQLLADEGLFAGTVHIEWPDLTERVLPVLFEAVDTYLLPLALATPLAFGLTALFFIRRRGLVEVSIETAPPRALAIGAGAAIAGWLLVSLVERVLGWLGLHQQEQEWILSIVDQGGSRLVGLAIFAILIAPLGEELFFRRYLFEGLDRSAGRVWAYGASTLIFALVHLNPPALVSYCLTGLILAAVYERTRSLTAAFATHGCFNAMSLAQLVLTS